MKDSIIALIKEKISVEFIEIKDRAAGHAHHKHYDGGAHYKMLIVSDDFKDLSLLKRHQLIYSILGHMITKEIHALALTTKTIKEYKSL